MPLMSFGLANHLLFPIVVSSSNSSDESLDKKEDPIKPEYKVEYSSSFHSNPIDAWQPDSKYDQSPPAYDGPNHKVSGLARTAHQYLWLLLEMCFSFIPEFIFGSILAMDLVLVLLFFITRWFES